jgi:hypothetical protein
MMKRTKIKVQRSVSPDGNAQAESWAIVVDEGLGNGLSEVMTHVASDGTSNQSSSQSRTVVFAPPHSHSEGVAIK